MIALLAPDRADADTQCQIILLALRGFYVREIVREIFRRVVCMVLRGIIL